MSSKPIDLKVHQSLSRSQTGSPSRGAQLSRLSQSPNIFIPYANSPFESSISSSLHRPSSYRGKLPVNRAGTISPTCRVDGFVPDTTYGSIGQSRENVEIVKRHLGTDAAEDEFASLSLQGGDIHRQVYQWQREQEQKNTLSARRSQSFYLPRKEPDDGMDVKTIKVPGGFRRNFIQQKAAVAAGHAESGVQPQFLTRNFIEFLSIYGHFAGEDLEEEEDETADESSQEEEGYLPHDGQEEERPLLSPRKTRKRAKTELQGNGSVSKAILLLLKSFVGTGVLFLPKAFLNGGMLFSSLVLLSVAAISMYCFLLLVRTRHSVPGSFGDIGGTLYGPSMRIAILTSITISQVGFVCAYTAFTAENLGAFIRAVTKGKTDIDIAYLIMIQSIFFLPLALIRDISKLSFAALIADLFILLGLVYGLIFPKSQLILLDTFIMQTSPK